MATLWLLGCVCVLICVGLTPRAEPPRQLVSITPDPKGNSDECTAGRAQGTFRLEDEQGLFCPPSLPPYASSPPLLFQSAQFPYPPPPRSSLQGHSQCLNLFHIVCSGDFSAEAGNQTPCCES